jgi:hypothetical protein
MKGDLRGGPSLTFVDRRSQSWLAQSQHPDILISNGKPSQAVVFSDGGKAIGSVLVGGPAMALLGTHRHQPAPISGSLRTAFTRSDADDRFP